MDLCRRQLAAGGKSVILTFDRGGVGPAFDVADLEHLPLDRHEADFVPRLMAALREFKADVVHAHGHVAAIYADMARLSGVPVVATIHASPLTDWRSLLATRRALRNADHLCAVSHDLAATVSRITHREVSMVSTGVELARFQAVAPLRQHEGPVSIGTAGRLHAVKRQADLLDAGRCLSVASSHSYCGERSAGNVLAFTGRRNGCRFPWPCREHARVPRRTGYLRSAVKP